jgi:hypothetical protein
MLYPFERILMEGILDAFVLNRCDMNCMIMIKSFRLFIEIIVFNNGAAR